MSDNEIWELWQEVKSLREENKQLKTELIHYLGELKLHYSRPDSKRFCEEKIHKLKNS